MSVSDFEGVHIPARITAQELANAIEADVTEVQAVLTARGEPGTPDEVLSAEVARQTAKVLGVRVTVEVRDLALETLYIYESTGEDPDQIDGRLGHLVRGVLASVDDLDSKIEVASEHWSVARMPVLDRNILRMGLFELEEDQDTPTAVIVSEAVRLAQTYSTERSGSFVNGVLATLAKGARPE